MSRALAVAVAAAALACAHANVSTEFDPKADYARYRTWAWIPQAPGEEEAPAVRDPAVAAFIRSAVERELPARGLAPANGAAPDLLVAFHGVARDRVEVASYGYVVPAGPYGMYGAPMYATDVRQYREGTLVLDLVDARKKQLVWRGVATDTVTSPSQVKHVVDGAVRDLLVHYPPEVPAAK
jgi:hypothetical protein